MLRLCAKVCRFSTEFYHPDKFCINLETLENESCLLAHYISFYRKHGHIYAKLDPLGIYNKYF